MKSLYGLMFLLAFTLFSACGDDKSSSSVDPIDVEDDSVLDSLSSSDVEILSSSSAEDDTLSSSSQILDESSSSSSSESVSSTPIAEGSPDRVDITWSAAVDSAAVFSNQGKDCGFGKQCNLEKIRGVCPEGWHLPSEAEWKTLFDFVGGIDVAGHRLKAASEYWIISHWGDEDNYKFTLLPPGQVNIQDMGEVFFAHSRVLAYLWTSTEIG